MSPFDKSPNRRVVWSWMFYDFANTIFSMNIITMYFAQWVVIDLAMGESALKRVGQPEDLAFLVAFLASDKAKHITGEIIKVDGGQYI